MAARSSTTPFGRRPLNISDIRPMYRTSTSEGLAKTRPLNCRPKKPQRIISVYYYPNCVLKLNITYDKNDYISAGGIKEILNDILRIEQCYTPFFGIYSGTLENPKKLLSDTDLLPENTSQFSFLKLGFKIAEEGRAMIFDKSAEELLFLETLYQFASQSIVPYPDIVTQQCLNKIIQDKNVATFWRLLNHRSSCCSIKTLATCQRELFRPATSLCEGIMVIKIALDLKGINFFDSEGEILIMTWPWASIANIKVQTHRTQLFMFDIVVREEQRVFVRTIIVQTPSCGYLLSVANYILKIHKINPEFPIGIELRGGSSQYESQFKAKHFTLKPYALVFCQSKTYFQNYSNEGYSIPVQSEITNNVSEFHNIAYSRPLAFYIPEKNNRLPLFKNEVKISTYKVYYYSKFSMQKMGESESDSRYKESYINVQVGTPSGRPVKVKDVKLAVGKSLNMSRRSLKYFGLFTNIISRRIDLLQDNDDMPSSFLGLCFRTTVMTWNRDKDIEQWKCLTNDEKAACIAFWEVAAAHGSLLKDSELLLMKFIYQSSLCNLLYTLGLIADMYYVDNCLLLNEMVTSTNIRYNEGSQVILSVDEERLHVWDNSSGKRITSFSWCYIMAIKLQHQPKIILSYTLAKGHESGYHTLSFQTNGGPFLFLFSKQFSKNVDKRMESMCDSRPSVTEMGESSGICEMATNNGMDISKTCKEMINSLVKEAECYAKQNEEDSIWRLIEKIERRIRGLPSTDTALLRRKWSEELYHKAGYLMSYVDEITTVNHHEEDIKEFEGPEGRNTEETYCSQRWTNVMKQSSLLIEPRSGLRSYVSFMAHPQQPIDMPPPPHLSSLISLLSRYSPSQNGKHFLNCFMLTGKNEERRHMTEQKRSSTKGLVTKYKSSNKYSSCQ